METSTKGRTQRRTARKTTSNLQSLQTEIDALKLQIARLETAIDARQQIEPVYHIPQSLAELKPRREPPPGKTAMEMIQGQWPGEESTEQLLAQLKALG